VSTVAVKIKKGDREEEKKKTLKNIHKKNYRYGAEK
jgi:hypothetical protein